MTKSIVDVERGQIFQIAKLVDESVVHATRQCCRFRPFVGQIIANGFDALEMALVDGVSHVDTARGRRANTVRIVWRVNIVSNILLLLTDATIVAQHGVPFPQNIGRRRRIIGSGIHFSCAALLGRRRDDQFLMQTQVVFCFSIDVNCLWKINHPNNKNVFHQKRQ